MGETSEKTLSPFVLGRLGGAIRERTTLYPTLPSRLYDLVMRLDTAERPANRVENPEDVGAASKPGLPEVRESWARGAKRNNC